jgi:hypothetical protein
VVRGRGEGGGCACLRRWLIRRLQFWPRLNSNRWSLKSCGRRFSKAQAREQAVAALVLTRAYTQARTRAHTHTHAPGVCSRQAVHRMRREKGANLVQSSLSHVSRTRHLGVQHRSTLRGRLATRVTSYKSRGLSLGLHNLLQGQRCGRWQRKSVGREENANASDCTSADTHARTHAYTHTRARTHAHTHAHTHTRLDSPAKERI